ncbi:MAG: LCP family protein [Anaerolineales bacterium]|nr:LCP family protein [Anaerolineales bacterium]
MTRSQKYTIGVLSIIACALLGGLGYYAYANYQSFAAQPLGPALPVNQQSLPPTWTASPGPSPTLAGSVTLVPLVNFPTSTPQAFCGGPNIMNILLVGADTRGDNYTYGLADAIRVVRVDFSIPKVTMLEFPRDLWVEIPYISDDLNGQDHEKLNQAYLYGQPGFQYWDDPSAGPGLLALTLNKNFGVQTEHYVSINMRTFENIINALGGIDVNIKDERASKSTGLPIGTHHLDGAGALKVARNRGGGSFERADNQNIVLCALRKKLTSPNVVTQIPALIESFQDNIRTDFTPEQISQLVCVGTKLLPQNIVLTSFPQELFTQTREFDPVFDKRIAILDADFNILSDYVRKFHAGTWPAPILPAASSIAPENEDVPLVCD